MCTTSTSELSVMVLSPAKSVIVTEVNPGSITVGTTFQLSSTLILQQ
jgi:hypothetical protein